MSLNFIEQSFMQWLQEQDVQLRLGNYRRYEDYYDGDHTIRLPEKLKKALQDDLGFIDNYCRRVVDIPVAFLSGADLGLEVTFGDELFEQIEDQEQRKAALALAQAEQRAKEAERFLYQVYKDSSLIRKNLIKALRIQGKKGELAFKVILEGDKDADGKLIRNENLRIRIMVLRPDIVFPKWSDEDYERMEACAIKYPRINRQTGRSEVFAQVWTLDTVTEYVSVGDSKVWVKTREEPNIYGVIPIVWCKNKEDDIPWGRSDLEDIIPIQDAINKTLTDLMVLADYQAFQKTFLLGHRSDPKDDIQLGPGTLTALSSPEAKVHTVEPANPEGLLAILKQLLEEVSAISGIPQRMFNKGEGFGQLSGVALKIAFMSLIDLAEEKSALLKDALEWVNWIVFVMAAKEGLAPDYTDLETKIHLDQGLPTDEDALTTRVTKEVDAGLKSRETAMKEIGIEDVDAEMERIERERQSGEDEFLLQALANIQTENEFQQQVGGEGPSGQEDEEP